MPTVGKKHFPYTPAGKEQAKKVAAKTGKPVVSKFGKGGYSTGNESVTKKASNPAKGVKAPGPQKMDYGGKVVEPPSKVGSIPRNTKMPPEPTPSKTGGTVMPFNSQPPTTVPAKFSKGGKKK